MPDARYVGGQSFGDTPMTTATYDYDTAKTAINPAFPAKPMPMTHPPCHSFPATTTHAAFSVCVWLSKDPIGEQGGINLNAFLANCVINWVDKIGLTSYTISKCEAFLYIGHQRKKTQELDVDSCGVAGTVGCFPESNNLKWNDPRRWPNIPTHNNPILDGVVGKRAAEWHSRTQGQTNERFDKDDPRDEFDFSKAVANALSTESKNSIMDRLCKECCKNVTFVIEIGKDKWYESIIKEAVEPYGYESGKRYTEVKECPKQ